MNIFAIEQPLLDRLRQALPSEVQVLTAPYLEDLRDLQQRARRVPAVFVMYVDGVPVGQGASFALRLVQRWSLVVATLNRADVLSGAPARQQAGELAWQVIGLLHGWRPDPQTRPMQCQRILSPIYLDGGLQLLPLVFAHETPRIGAIDE